MKHLKSINEYMSEKTPEEEQFDKMLDRRQKLTPEIVNSINNKEVVYSETDNLEFIQTEVKDFGSEVQAHGTLKYNGKEYIGYITLPKEDDNRGRNTWYFADSKEEFEPDQDDFYTMDNLCQQVEMRLLDQNQIIDSE